MNAEAGTSEFRVARANKSALIGFAERHPADFRKHLQRIVEQLETGLQVAGQTGGRNVAVYDGLEASPDWRLIVDVLDVVWPEEKGRIHARKMEPLRRIIYRTKAHAVGPDEELKRERRGDLVNNDMISTILTLRYQINSLNKVIRFIEERLHYFDRIINRERIMVIRMSRLYRCAYYPLITWRRELERRLTFGDYRPWKEELRRPTGGTIHLPEMPKLRNAMPLWKRALRLVRAATLLRSAPTR